VGSRAQQYSLSSNLVKKKWGKQGTSCRERGKTRTTCLIGVAKATEKKKKTTNRKNRVQIDRLPEMKAGATLSGNGGEGLNYSGKMKKPGEERKKKEERML